MTSCGVAWPCGAVGRLLAAVSVTLAAATPCPAEPAPAAPSPFREPRHVLVLQSYNLGHTWADGVWAGIRSGFAGSEPPVELFVEYMDTKRLPVDEASLSRLTDLLEGKYRQTRFDVLIACDDDAFAFLRTRRDELFPGVPLVFVGVNDFTPGMLDGRLDLTGVVEDVDYLGTVAAALRLRPGTRTVVAVTDETTSGRAQRSALEKLAPQMPAGVGLRFLSLGETTLDDLGRRLAALPSDAVVLMLNCMVDRHGQSYPVESVTPYLCQRSSVPVFVLSDGRIGLGAIGGLVTSGHAQGQAAAAIAISILNGADAASIPVSTKSPNQHLFDDIVMRRFGIAASDLPPGSTVLNRRPSIMEAYAKQVTAAAAVLVTMTLAALLLGLEVLRRRRVEGSLHKSEEALAGILNSVPQGIFWKDRQGVYLGCNENFAKAVGLKGREKIAGRTDFDLPWRTTDAEAYRADDAEVIAGGQAKRHIVEPLRQADGDLRWIDTTKVPLKDEGGQVYGVLGVYEDVTERRKADEERARLLEQLQQASKMEAIGRLAGGIAHDFNNLLMAIGGNTEMARRKSDPEGPAARYLLQVEKAAESAAALTGHLLAFSRKQIVEPRVVAMNDLVAHLQKLLARLIGEDVELRTVLAEGLGAVRVDPAQFEHVLVNLAVNARDAMPQGGTLLIETANANLDEHYCARHADVEPGAFVMVAVTDTGCGMSDEVKRRLFEPFFTTKPKGRGTGLGLAMAFGSVKQAGGSIEVYSELGRGTTVKVYLPRVFEAPRPLVAESPGQPPAAGHETVLVVEDDEGVRTWVLAILGQLGYDVLHAASGAEALALVDARRGGIDLLLTDVVMPGMNGRELAEQLLCKFPNLKVLYSSGYTDNVIVHHGLVDENVHFIAKPYSMDALAAKLRQVLRS